jgi:hypothetical protein
MYFTYKEIPLSKLTEEFQSLTSVYITEIAPQKVPKIKLLQNLLIDRNSTVIYSKCFGSSNTIYQFENHPNLIATCITESERLVPYTLESPGFDNQV